MYWMFVLFLALIGPGFVPVLAADVELACALKRKITQEGGRTYYTVSDRAPTLYMISRDLYGHAGNWRLIAQWNHLEEPYALSPGQRLEIKKAPTSEESAANKTLIEAWLKIDNLERVHRLSGYAVNQKGICEEKSVEEERMPATQEPTEVPAARAAVETSTSKQADIHPSPEIHREWALRPMLTGSVFELKSDDSANAIKNTFYSKFNYGASLELGRTTPNQAGFYLLAGVEHIEFETAAGGAITLDQKNFSSFGLRLEQHLGSAFMTSLSAHYVERPFARATLTGAAVDAVFVPEAKLGMELRVFTTMHTQTWLVADGLYSFEIKDRHHDVEAGYGCHAGLRWIRGTENQGFSVSLLYRQLLEKTELSKNSQQAALINLGIRF